MDIFKWKEFVSSSIRMTSGIYYDKGEVASAKSANLTATEATVKHRPAGPVSTTQQHSDHLFNGVSKHNEDHY